MNANKKNQENYSNSADSESQTPGGEDNLNVGCSIKPLPARLLSKAAETATKINPVNAPSMQFMMDMGGGVPMDPQSLTMLTSKYWGPMPRRLTVSFMESTIPALRKKIVEHMNAWTRTCCISFVETSGVGQVRISFRGSGYWSYLGTDVLLIPRHKPTMNLQGFTINTSEREFTRVVRHETGHTLGFTHEHMRQELVNRIDRNKAYEYFARTQGWNRAMVDAQVLTSLDIRTIMFTRADETSIMCYQLPGSITRDGRPIQGGLDINATDYGFAGAIYPKVGSALSQEQFAIPYMDEDNEWAEGDDVGDNEIEEVIQGTLYNTNGFGEES